MTTSSSATSRVDSFGLGSWPTNEALTELELAPSPEVAAELTDLPRPSRNSSSGRQPATVRGLATPAQAAPGVVARAVAALQGTSELRRLSGRVWDLALVAALERKWRNLTPQLATLDAAQTRRLADEVVRSLIADRRLGAADADGRRLAAYAVRLEVERARESVAQPAAAAPKPRVATPVAGAPPAPAAVTANPSAAIAALQRLILPANASDAQKAKAALDAQRIVDATIRKLIRTHPEGVDAFLRDLREVSVPVSLLPIDFNEGWRVAVADGQPVGQTNTQLAVAPTLLGQRYRFGLRSLQNDRTIVVAPVDLMYSFGEDNRTTSAQAYARTLVEQERWTHAAGWSSHNSPYDIDEVRTHFQGLLERGTPMAEVMARWQAYLTNFYLHATSIDLPGDVQVGKHENLDTRRLSNDVQGWVDDVLQTNTGQRLIDCEFFASLTVGVFGSIRRNGQPWFDTYWVKLDTHVATVIVERGQPGAARNWAFVNNHAVRARGTTTSAAALDQQIVDTVARHIGRPAIFAFARKNDGRLTYTSLGGPRVGAYMYDGDVSRVTELDARAYWIFAATREDRLPDQPTFEEFVRSWSRPG